MKSLFFCLFSVFALSTLAGSGRTSVKLVDEIAKAVTKAATGGSAAPIACPLIDGCPIQNTPQTNPGCGRVDSGNITILCAKQKLWAGYAGNFYLNEMMPTNITKIIVNSNRKGYCSQPSGVGTMNFQVQCSCDKLGHVIESQWTVYR